MATLPPRPALGARRLLMLWPSLATPSRASRGQISGDSVAMPQSLWEHLTVELAAGDASVDVMVTRPFGCLVGWCGSTVLS